MSVSSRIRLILAISAIIILTGIIYEYPVIKGWFWEPPTVPRDLPADSLIQYGYHLISQTYRYIGPDVADSEMRYAGNNLTCQNCHIDGGTRRRGGSFFGVTNRYPSYRKRSGKIGSIQDRINGCMQRSMNGHPLPFNSREMKAMVAYLEWLSNDVPQSKANEYKGFVSLKIPDVRADTSMGHQVFVKNCTRCHGNDGQGQLLGKKRSGGYLYPPLWGPDSFNDGAGMHRVLTAAAFIKGNMPFGTTYDHPVLTDLQAYQVAAYINAQNRPHKSGLENDYPDLNLKPVDCPYPPYADTFPRVQHQFGPFQPIKAYYRKKKTH